MNTTETKAYMDLLQMNVQLVQIVHRLIHGEPVVVQEALKIEAPQLVAAPVVEETPPPDPEPVAAPRARKPRVDRGYAGLGTCPICHKESQRLYSIDGNGGQPVCYGCRQAALRATRPVRFCVICGNEIPPEMSKLAKICSPECRKVLNRKIVAEHYARKHAKKAS